MTYQTKLKGWKAKLLSHDDNYSINQSWPPSLATTWQLTSFQNLFTNTSTVSKEIFDGGNKMTRVRNI